MAIAGVTEGDENSIKSLSEAFDYEIWVHTSGAGKADDPYAGRIMYAGYPS